MMFRSLFVGLAGAGAASFAAAQDGSSADGPLFGAWKIQCEANAPCLAYVNLMDAESEQLALTAAFYFIPGAEAPTAVLTFPLGVALKPGLRLSSAALGEPIALQPEVCYPDGCRAAANLTAEQAAALNQQEHFRVSFFVYGREIRPAAVDVPVDGLAAALAHLRAKDGAKD
ncbi:invasion associated locus B family protein [Amphiplicatus metriothermophilus]|nr:invasion associated locus B family protein [Amphiplicatus metriothermophilus]MBB5517800.1 invasion protein IalB [Amphiplicatus metriothermophilus]